MAYACEDADKSYTGVPPEPPLSFNSTGENWDAVLDETRAPFGIVLRMESVKKAELAFAFGFSVALLMLAR